MKKLKVNIMKWLGVYQRMVQLELEIERLESKLIDQDFMIDENKNNIDEKVDRYDVEDTVKDMLSDISMSDHEYELHEIIEDWADSYLDEYVSRSTDRAIDHLTDSDKIRELVCAELENSPLLENLKDDTTENTTWDMNEIVQEVLDELITRLS